MISPRQARFVGGTLDGQTRWLYGAWPDRYQHLTKGELYRHMGGGHYTLTEPTEDLDELMARPVI